MNEVEEGSQGRKEVEEAKKEGTKEAKKEGRKVVEKGKK